MNTTIELIAAQAHNEPAVGDPRSIRFDSASDPRDVALDGVARVDLHFPKFTDGRAYSQAFLLRRRLGFRGEIRATGDVQLDQLVQLQRAGFDSAVLRHETPPTAIARQFVRFTAFYQGDAVERAPLFGRGAPAGQKGQPDPRYATSPAARWTMAKAR